MPDTNQDREELDAFLLDAGWDALARAGDLFDRTPLTTAFAEAEIALIQQLRDLMAEDESARAFVRRWRSLVETTDEYPQRRGARLPSSGDVQWTIGAQRLRCAVTLWDAFVRDDIVTGCTGVVNALQSCLLPSTSTAIRLAAFSSQISLNVRRATIWSKLSPTSIL